MSIANDYGVVTSNGSNGGHDKIFDLKKADDPLLSKIVPEARRRVCQNTKIPESARMFFCWLTDMSLLFGIYLRKGVVKFSDGDLAARFRVSDKTIRNWKRWIESTGEIWLTEKWMKNSFPQTVYNITAIVGQATLPMNVESEDGSLTDDPVFSSNRRRLQSVKRSGAGKFVCRVHGTAACDICRRKTPPRIVLPVDARETSSISEQSEPSGKILPSSTAIDCRPPRQMVAVHHGKSLPSPTAIDCRPARKKVAVGGGNELPQSAANGFRTARQTVADNNRAIDREKSLSEKRGSKSTPPDEFDEWKKGLKGMYQSKLRRLESDLQAELNKARSPEAKAEWKKRLAAVRAQLMGGAVDDKPVATAKAAKPEPKAMTDEEVYMAALQSINAAKASGMKPLLTDRQRALLEKEGVTV